MAKIGDEVYNFTTRLLKRITSVSESTNKYILAQLRHGVGKKPGDDPRLWGIIFEGMSESLMSKNGEPSDAEWAIYTAATIYAVHQQGKNVKNESMNVEGMGVGCAAANMVSNEDDRNSIERRLYALASTDNMQGISHYLRGFVQLLRNNDIGLDYPQLAKELYFYQIPELAPGVRLKWGQDYYSELNKRIKEDKND